MCLNAILVVGKKINIYIILLFIVFLSLFFIDNLMLGVVNLNEHSIVSFLARLKFSLNRRTK